MSLMVWLPLNGDLTNQGLLGPLTQTSAPSYTSNGKIGKALSAGGVSMSAEQTSQVFNNNEVSICFWVYPNIDAGGTSGLLFGNNAMSAGNNRKFSIFLYPTINDLHLSWQNDTADTTFQGSIDTGLFPSYTWTHLAVVYKNPNIYIYINGNLIKTYTNKISNSSTFAYTTQVINDKASRYINDLRVYNHALSAKEVKEISKGLVLHYPLHGGEGGTNLLKGIATRIATSAGLTSSGTLEYDSSLLPLNSLIGKTFLFSYDYSVEGAKANATGDWSKDRYGAHLSLTYKDASGNTGTAYPGAGYLEVSGTGRAVQSYTCSSSWTEITSLTVAVQPYNQPASGNTNTWYIKNFKIELGNVDTGYSINPNTMGVIANQAIDYSGYDYNGTVSTALEHSSDCVRYNSAANFASDKKIYTPTLPTFGLANSYTIAWWAKTSVIDGKMFWGFSDGNRLNLYGGIYCNTGDSHSNPFIGVSAPSLNVWHHYAMVGNGSTVGLYIDGVLKGNATTYKPITGTQIYLNGWASATDYDFNGLMNDFRVYATALSASDIKELYQIPISIDKNGNIFSSEFVEEIKPEFHKSGIVEASDFYENLIFHDMEFKTLSDGSLWARILHHNNKGGTVLFTKDNAINYQSTDLYSRLYALEGYRNIDGKFEFMVIQPDLDANKIYRWKQSSNPVTDSTIAGYENITNGQGGLVKCSNSTYCAVSPTNSNWWCAVGCYTAYQGGIPGFGTNVVTGTLDLYVRIPTINKASVYKKQYIASNQIIEV